MKLRKEGLSEIPSQKLNFREDEKVSRWNKLRLSRNNNRL